jgi:guanylate kinase
MVTLPNPQTPNLQKQPVINVFQMPLSAQNLPVQNLPVQNLPVQNLDSQGLGSQGLGSQGLGRLLVLSGPSGVGKGTLLKQLLKRHPELQVSISATTRQPRPGEIDGQHYHFVGRAEFERMIEQGELLEWAEFAGNFYGTPKAPIAAAIAQGKQVILEIELVGARQVRACCPEIKQIFVRPPSAETLEHRIRSRGQDSEAAIAKRLNQAQVELAAASEFDVQIVNDDLETAIAALETAIFS